MDFVDLKAQYQRLKAPIQTKINAVLEHGQFIMGPEIRELEEKLRAYTGAKHCITCASGTDALLMALMAWGVGPGDAVFCPPFTFFATAEVVALLGATPVFVDIDAKTYNLDAAKLEKAIVAVRDRDSSIHPLPVGAEKGLRPKVVIPVDLFGLAAEYEPILAVAAKYNVLVLEDAAQSFGGSYHGKKTCGLGCHASATSFFPAKPLGCYGDGGALFTDDDGLAELFTSIRVHGKGGHKYDNARIGINGRLDTLQAAVLIPKLEILDEEIAERQRVADGYTRGLSASGIPVPETPASSQSAWAQYTIRVDRRDAVQEALKKAGVPTNIYYPLPLHRQNAMAYLGYKEDDFPVSMRASREVLSLPMHPYLKREETDTVVAELLAAVK